MFLVPVFGDRPGLCRGTSVTRVHSNPWQGNKRTRRCSWKSLSWLIQPDPLASTCKTEGETGGPWMHHVRTVHVNCFVTSGHFCDVLNLFKALIWSVYQWLYNYVVITYRTILPRVPLLFHIYTNDDVWPPKAFLCFCSALKEYRVHVHQYTNNLLFS